VWRDATEDRRGSVDRDYSEMRISMEYFVQRSRAISTSSWNRNLRIVPLLATYIPTISQMGEAMRKARQRVDGWCVLTFFFVASYSVVSSYLWLLGSIITTDNSKNKRDGRQSE